jgi:broad specificity phosphatase PhoE
MRGPQVLALCLVRHGETLGESSIRYYGATDVPLSDLGREQMRLARRALGEAAFDRVVASPLARSRESAQILMPGAALSIEPGFREVNFGRWEGLTRDEIEARDPELFARWQASPASFDYPDGERRADFVARVAAGLERVLALPSERLLLAVHKGVIRTIVSLLCERVPSQPWPELGAAAWLSRHPAGSLDSLGSERAEPAPTWKIATHT